jgi:hypothetical protein
MLPLVRGALNRLADDDGALLPAVVVGSGIDPTNVGPAGGVETPALTELGDTRPGRRESCSDAADVAAAAGDAVDNSRDDADGVCSVLRAGGENGVTLVGCSPTRSARCAGVAVLATARCEG